MSDEVFKRVLRWRLKKQRLSKGYTQEEAAERAGISLKRYQHLELGLRDFNPTVNTLLHLCKVLDITVEALFKNPDKQEAEASKRTIKRRAPKTSKK